MGTLLIADKDARSRTRMTEILSPTGMQILTADSVIEVLRAILKKDPQVVLLGGELDSMPLVQLVPLLKKCNPALTIILISDEASLPQIRKFRREGIFYHALRPLDRAGEEELIQAVRCAFEKSRPADTPGWMARRLNSATLIPN